MLIGRAYIKMNGQLLRSNPGAKIDLGGPQRTTIMGDFAVHGHSVQTKQSRVECELSLNTGESLEGLRAAQDVTITFEADSGHNYLVRDAALIDTLVVTAQEGGKIPVVFEGQPAEEL